MHEIIERSKMQTMGISRLHYYSGNGLELKHCRRELFMICVTPLTCITRQSASGVGSSCFSSSDSTKNCPYAGFISFRPDYLVSSQSSFCSDVNELFSSVHLERPLTGFSNDSLEHVIRQTRLSNLTWLGRRGTANWVHVR
jgi:hypothetical protein